MKHKKSEEIETTELCAHGCGNTAKYKTRGGKLICESSSNKCPAVRVKNSEGLKEAYSSGQRIAGKNRYESLPQETKDRMNWSKGKIHTPEFKYDGKGNHKGFLISERGHRCEKCGLTEWLGQPIMLELEHVDGVNRNHSKDNLKLLCPNCHSQTPTWRSRNKKSCSHGKISDSEFMEALEKESSVHGALKSLNLTPKGGNYKRALRILGDMVELKYTADLKSAGQECS